MRRKRQLRIPVTSGLLEDFAAALRNAEIHIRMGNASAVGWQDIADVLFVIGRAAEIIRGASDPDVRVIVGSLSTLNDIGKRGCKSSVWDPKDFELANITIGIDRAMEVARTINDVRPLVKAWQELRT